MERSYPNYPNNPNRNNSVNDSTVRCKHCGKNIIQSNYLIHEARCGLMNSRVQPNNQSQSTFERPYQQSRPPQSSYVPSNYFREEPRRVEVVHNQGGNMHRQRQNLFNKREQPIQPRFQRPVEPRREQEQQKIPCPFCGYMQTLAELDTHPQNCEHRQQECPECHQNFPRSLMDEHLMVCSVQRRPREHEHHRRLNVFPGQQEQEENYNPFGNFRGLLGMLSGGGRRREEQRNYDIQQRQNPGFQRGSGRMVIFQRSDGRGNYIRQIIPQEQLMGAQQNRQNPRAAYSPFMNFFNLLELMAARQAPREVGLTKDEIKNLKRITYQGDNKNKPENEKDLCTICYCEFEKDEKLVELRCKHVYHEECITKWVERNAKCPVCKTPQTDRPIFTEEEQEQMMM